MDGKIMERKNYWILVEKGPRGGLKKYYSRNKPGLWTVWSVRLKDSNEGDVIVSQDLSRATL